LAAFIDACHPVKAGYCEDQLGHVGPQHARNILGWIIVGGESGPKARPFDVAWARSIIRQGAAHGRAVFVKQLGSNPTSDHRSRPPGEEAYWTRVLGHKKGGDAAEWPPDLRVRQFPVTCAVCARALPGPDGDYCPSCEETPMEGLLFA
jgi:hypothetical protein